MSHHSHVALQAAKNGMSGIFCNNILPEYPLEHGIELIIKQLQSKMAEDIKNIVVLVAGGSSSGKTSAIAHRIRDRFPEDTTVLSADDYYRGKRFMKEQEEQGIVLNWDQPEALDLELLRSHLYALKDGKTITKPVYSMAVSEPVSKETVEPRKIIVAEGLFNLSETLKNEGDLNIFVNISRHGRIIRRLLRDVDRTGDHPEQIIRYFAEVVEPMHERYIEPTKQHADIIINNDYSAETESTRCQTNEVQVKFPWKESIHKDMLTKTGIHRLKHTIQKDYYYTSKERVLQHTGEVIRLREVGEKVFLTYKGPLLNSTYRKRPSITFEINQHTKELFLSLYDNLDQVVTKESTAYSIEGIRVSLDRVTKGQERELRELGCFLEIQSDNEHQIEHLIDFLELNREAGVHMSYADM